MNTTPDPNSQGYTNALLEDVNDKFQVLVDGQSAINERLDRNTELLNTTFEEVGRLRVDVDALKIGVTDLKEEVKGLTKEVRDNKVRIDRIESN